MSDLGWVDDPRFHHIDVYVVHRIVAVILFVLHDPRHHVGRVDAGVGRDREAWNTEGLADDVDSCRENKEY